MKFTKNEDLLCYVGKRNGMNFRIEGCEKNYNVIVESEDRLKCYNSTVDYLYFKTLEDAINFSRKFKWSKYEDSIAVFTPEERKELDDREKLFEFLEDNNIEYEDEYDAYIREKDGLY